MSVINGTEVMMPPPDNWGPVNFTHPFTDDSTKTSVMWAFGIEFPVATIFLATRLYTSVFVLNKVRADDYLLTIGYTILTGCQAMCLYCWTNGGPMGPANQLVGLHAWEQPLDTTIYFTKFITAITLTAILGTVSCKLTLCVFYSRLSPGTWYRWSIYFTSFVCVAGFGSVFFAVLFACKPVEAGWNLRLNTGDNCISLPPWYMLQAITGGVTDFLLMINPIPTVIGLQMSNKQKAGLLAWFGIGTVTLVAAIMRLVSLLSMLNSPDSPWTMAQAMLWLIVEANLIVVCGSLPTFRVFLNHLFSRKDTTKGSTGPSSAKNTKNSHALRTFGQGRTRQFDTIAELEHGDQFNNENYYNVSAQAGKGGPVSRISESGSQEAILQTKTATVSYSNAPHSRGG